MLRYHPTNLRVNAMIERYHGDCRRLRKVIPKALSGQARRTYTRSHRQFLKQGFPDALARELAEISIPKPTCAITGTNWPWPTCATPCTVTSAT